MDMQMLDGNYVDSTTIIEMLKMRPQGEEFLLEVGKVLKGLPENDDSDLEIRADYNIDFNVYEYGAFLDKYLIVTLEHDSETGDFKVFNWTEA